MEYKLCPKCEAVGEENYIKVDEEMCCMCRKEAEKPKTKQEKSEYITTEEFYRGENTIAVSICKKLHEKIESAFSDVTHHALSGTGGNKGYLSLKKDGKAFVNLELRGEYVRVNFTNYVVAKSVKTIFEIDIRSDGKSCAFSLYEAEKISAAMELIELAYKAG